MPNLVSRASTHRDPSSTRWICSPPLRRGPASGTRGYTATDIISRYKRMQGYNVLHPMGFDAFGLPAEQHAINTGEHPASFTQDDRQLPPTAQAIWFQLRLGPGVRHDRRGLLPLDAVDLRADLQAGTTMRSAALPTDQRLIQPWRAARDGSRSRADSYASPRAKATEALAGDHGRPPVARPECHRATHIHRQPPPAYVGEQTVNWCPALGTVLANEEVIDGRSERGGRPAQALKQWLFRITALADRLLTGLDENRLAREHQNQARVDRTLRGARSTSSLDLDLNNPDTDTEFTPRSGSLRPSPTRFSGDVHGGRASTTRVCGPESPRKETPVDVLAACRGGPQPLRQGPHGEQGQDRVLHRALRDQPATSERIPVWTSDYVLATYGFGAIMAVPAHDKARLRVRQSSICPSATSSIRTIPAMSCFVQNANEEERTTDRWKHVLADFLGLVTTSSLPPMSTRGARGDPHTPRTTRARSSARTRGARSVWNTKRRSKTSAWTTSPARIDLPRRPLFCTGASYAGGLCHQFHQRRGLAGQPRSGGCQSRGDRVVRADGHRPQEGELPPA